MRLKAIPVLMMALPALAFAGAGVVSAHRGSAAPHGRRGHARPGAHGGQHGGRAGGGLGIHYNKKTSHSNLSIRYRSGLGARRYGTTYRTYGGTSLYYGGGTGSVTVHSGWYPYSPTLYRRYRPRTSTGAVGPFSYVSGVHFGGSVGVPVFGQAPAVAGPVAPLAAARPAAPAAARDARKRSPQQLVDEGDALFGLGEFTSAVGRYREAAEGAPDDPMPAFALGHGLLALGQYAPAAEQLRRGIRLFPDIVHVRMNLGDFYPGREDFAAHLERLRRYCQVMPKDTAARFLLGYACFFTQNYGEAQAHLESLGAAHAEAQALLAEIQRIRQ